MEGASTYHGSFSQGFWDGKEISGASDPRGSRSLCWLPGWYGRQTVWSQTNTAYRVQQCRRVYYIRWKVNWKLGLNICRSSGWGVERYGRSWNFASFVNLILLKICDIWDTVDHLHFGQWWHSGWRPCSKAICVGGFLAGSFLRKVQTCP